MKLTFGRKAAVVGLVSGAAMTFFFVEDAAAGVREGISSFNGSFISHIADLFVKEVEASNDISPEAAAVMIKQRAAVLVGENVEALKDKVVDQIEQCESHGDYGIIIFDSNNEASIGGMQWQRKSVQHYIKKFEGRAISKQEAVEIAIDREKARGLAKRVMFEEEGGVNNWYNCARKVGAEAQIKLIKSL